MNNYINLLSHRNFQNCDDILENNIYNTSPFLCRNPKKCLNSYSSSFKWWETSPLDWIRIWKVWKFAFDVFTVVFCENIQASSKFYFISKILRIFQNDLIVIYKFEQFPLTISNVVHNLFKLYPDIYFPSNDNTKNYYQFYILNIKKCKGDTHLPQLHRDVSKKEVTTNSWTSCLLSTPQQISLLRDQNRLGKYACFQYSQSILTALKFYL